MKQKVWWISFYSFLIFSFSFDHFLVVLDTNKWYHMTEVLEGELSITIGAEYD